MQRSVKNGMFYPCIQRRLINKAKKYKSDISKIIKPVRNILLVKAMVLQP